MGIGFSEVSARTNEGRSNPRFGGLFTANTLFSCHVRDAVILDADLAQPQPALLAGRPWVAQFLLEPVCASQCCVTSDVNRQTDKDVSNRCAKYFGSGPSRFRPAVPPSYCGAGCDSPASSKFLKPRKLRNVLYRLRRLPLAPCAPTDITRIKVAIVGFLRQL